MNCVCYRKQSFLAAFTLLEIIAVIIVIGILTVFILPQVNNMMNESRENVTQQNLVEIKKAIIGDPAVNLRGFRQITGTTPNSLSELWDISGASAANPFQDQGQGETVFVEEQASEDGWGGSVVIGTTTDGDGVLISAGPDGSLAGGGDKDNYDVSGKDDDVILILPDAT